jgi:putative phage-type endonuclease
MEKIIRIASHLPPQKSKEWLELRKNKLTSTDIGTIIHGTQKAKADLIKKKNGYSKEPFTGNEATRHGEYYEDIALKKFADLYNFDPICVSMIQHATDERIIFSPDAILENGEIIEIKCPHSRIITGSISSQYQNQIQLGMEIMHSNGFEHTKCYFIEYKPANHNPKVIEDYDKEILSVKIVERDPKYFERIEEKCNDIWHEIQVHKQIENIDYNGFMDVEV